MKLGDSRLTVGFAIDWIPDWVDADIYQTRILSDIGSVAKEFDINLICFVAGRLGSPFDWERSRNILFDFIRREQLDGLILIPSVNIFGTEHNVLDLLTRFDGIPVVTVNDQYDGYHCISVDNQAGMRQIVDHIIEAHGRRRIVFIRGPEENGEANARFEAYRMSLANHGIGYDSMLVFPGLMAFDSGSDAVDKLLDRNIDFDAIIAANDNMAIGAMIELEKRLGKIPDNLSIAGFDDTDASRCLDLTTVKQSFYEHARTAVTVLLQIIRGEKAPLSTEIPTEMVLRTSCGCMSNRSTYVLNNVDSENNFSSTDEHIENGMLTEIRSLLDAVVLEKSIDNTKLYEYVDHLWTALQENVKPDAAEFLNTWKFLTMWVMEKRINLTLLHDILSVLRKYVYMRPNESTTIRHIEDIFQVARIQLCEVDNRAKASLSYQSALQINRSNQISEALIAELNIDNQMHLLADGLPELGIHQCYIVLYEDPHHPLEYARLIQAFSHKRCYVLDRNGLRFPTLNLLPDDVIMDMRKERFNVVVQALHHGDNQMGYVIFGFDGPINNTYEIMRYRLSIALKGTLLIENIRGQAGSLERQVVERTQDLSRINQQLHKEIAKRMDTEGQLKNVLRKLADYNQELRHRSIRDELTGLYNRRGFMEMGSKVFSQAQTSGDGFLILFADLDNLKQINDRHGHSEGDRALIQTARIFDQFFAENDIIARLSGDEFTIIMPEAAPKDLEGIRQQMDQCFEETVRHSPKPYKISISIGGVYYNPDSGLSFEDLMRMADESLYKEKMRRKVLPSV